MNNQSRNAAAPAAYGFNIYNPRPYKIAVEIPTRLGLNFLSVFTVFPMKFGQKNFKTSTPFTEGYFTEEIFLANLK